MPDLINSTSVTWSESGGDLTATATGRVASVQVNDDGTIGSASTASALVIDAAGNVTFNQDVDFDGAVTGISASDVNADPAGTAASAVSTHEGESNPHPQYATGGAQDTHSGLTNNPHSVTAAQVSAVALSGDTMTGDLTVPNIVLDDDGTIGSATDTDAIAISSGGVVTINEDLIVGGSHRAAAVDVNTQTGTSYTLVLSDAGKLVTLNNSSAITLTVPPNSSVAFQVGATIALAQLGAGTVSVAEGSGVTVSSLDDKVDLSGQYATASLVKTGTDAWLLVGALA